MSSLKTGIILLNMGGPSTLEQVRPFLYNLFSDRDIIPLGPKLLQKPIAWIIAKKRAPKSMATYKLIGGGSPLQKITRMQAAALADSLKEDGNFVADIAMRYWPPYSTETVQNMIDDGVQRIIALSLYPHYSKATTGSSLKHLRAAITKIDKDIPLVEIPFWPTQKSYVQAIATNIEEARDNFGHDCEIVYSAHSLPVSFIEEGDPYLEHTKQTIEAIEALTTIKGRLCFQSRSGPVEWLTPSTPDTLTEMANEGCKKVIIVPISFVSDHVETLYEIDIEYKELAESLGMQLHSCTSLNTQPLFIKALRELILENTEKF